MEKLWVDFNNNGIEGIRLTCGQTLKEIEDKKIVLHNGLEILIWDEDADDSGSHYALSVKATIKYSFVDKCWVAQYNTDELITDL